MPEDPLTMPPARRRRADRLLVPLDGDEKAAFLTRLARRTSPSVDFFLLSLIAGIALGFSLLVDHPGFLVLGAVLAPLMAPVVGLGLGTMIGSPVYFGRSLLGFLLGCFFAIVGGLIAGFISQFWFPAEYSFIMQTQFHARLHWVYGLMVIFGAIMTSAAMARAPIRSRASSVALAYGLYMPLVITGFGLTAGEPDLVSAGLVIFVLHFALAVLLSALTLGIFGYRPLTLFGYSIGGAVALLVVVMLIGVSGAGIAVGGQIAIPTYTPSPTTPPTATFTPSPTLTPTPTYTPTPTPTLTPTPVPPTATFTLTPVPPTPTPTPIFAVVRVLSDSGARIRSTPGGLTITVLANGTTVQVFEPPEEFSGGNWFRVLTPDGIEGWMLEDVLIIATPVPNWSP